VIAKWAKAIIAELHSYTEVSPSGSGVKIWLRGRLPARSGHQKAHCGGKVEMFDRGRYFTFTGMHVANTPVKLEERSSQLQALHLRQFGGQVQEEDHVSYRLGNASDEAVIQKARRARNGARFQKLFDRGEI